MKRTYEFVRRDGSSFRIKFETKEEAKDLAMDTGTRFSEVKEK